MRRMAELALKNMQTLIETIGTTSEGAGLRIEPTGFNAQTGFPTYKLCGPKDLLDQALAKMKRREGTTIRSACIPRPPFDKN